MDFSILFGDVALQGFNVLYDRENKRLGFSPVSSACSAIGASRMTINSLAGDNQRATIGQPFQEPLSISIAASNSTSLVETVHSVMVVFKVVEGQADFFPGLSNAVRNYTDDNGVASAMVTARSSGPIVIEVSIYDNNETKSIRFTLTGVGKTTSVPLIVGIFLIGFAALCLVDLSKLI
eukprot:gene3710-4275_t